MGKTNMDVPSLSRLVKTVEEFHSITKEIAHFAIKRDLGYFHHFVVIRLSGNELQTIEYLATIKNFFTGPGEVVKHDTSMTEIEASIANGNLYAIEAPNYPKTEQEIENAKERYTERLTEKDYQVACNNCEHLATYIMTGISYSEQMAKATSCKRGFVDLCDCLVSHGKRNGIKKVLNFLALLPVAFFTKDATSRILSAAPSISSPLSDPCNVVDICTDNFITVACKNTTRTKLELLKSKTLVAAAQSASRSAVINTVLVSAGVTTVVEVVLAIYGIYKSHKKKKKHIITERNFKREVTKTIFQGICAIIGSVGVGVIVQIVCPIPILGFALGSFFGNFLGRLFGCFIAGRVFDWSHKDALFSDEINQSLRKKRD